MILLDKASADPTVFHTIFNSANIWNTIFAAVVCIVLTILFYSFLDNWFQVFIVRALWRLKIPSKHNLSGKWTHRWHVTSVSFPAINEIKGVEIKQFRNWIYAQYHVRDNQQKLYTYKVKGRIQNDMIITGTWKDVEPGHRYNGCFQLYIDLNENHLIGYWTGVSSDAKIKSDKWEWVREN
jgi:hypothetical protein